MNIVFLSGVFWTFLVLSYIKNIILDLFLLFSKDRAENILRLKLKI